MKKILQIFIAVVFIFGAVQQTMAYTCSDDIVKNQAIELYRVSLKELCNKFYGMKMLESMGQGRMNLEESQEMEKMCKNLMSKNSKLTITKVMTTNIDKSTNKHNCIGLLEINSNKQGKVIYTFQHTNDGKDVLVQIEE